MVFVLELKLHQSGEGSLWSRVAHLPREGESRARRNHPNKVNFYIVAHNFDSCFLSQSKVMVVTKSNLTVVQVQLQPLLQVLLRVQRMR